jgi:DNA-directed RNA polymerase alpha subunit
VRGRCPVRAFIFSDRKGGRTDPAQPLGEIHVSQHQELAGTEEARHASTRSRLAIRKRKATFVAEPLERGFGLTLGNALRRVLLSSLQGAAITSIKIENVLHEFSSLAGVREDVTDIVLNVKQIALKMQGEGPKRCSFRRPAPTVKAGDIAVTGDIEVMNKDLVICHLDEGATLNMELTADTGKGYVPAAPTVRQMLRSA